MKKTIQSLQYFCLAVLVFFTIFTTKTTFAQDANAEGNKPVSGTFNSGIFLENQTTMMYDKGVYEFVINHRFGKLSDGFKELYGIYSPSNIRFGLNYNITNKIQLGLGTTKYNKQQDLNYKIGLVEQTVNNKMPVSIAYFGATYFDAREKETSFGYSNYSFAHRFSFFNEIMISRKVSEKISLQAALTYAHINITESSSATSAQRLRRPDQFGISAIGKFNITPTMAFICEYDHNFSKLYKKETDVFKDPKPNITIGFENATAAHSFQLFITTASDISYQTNMIYNQNQFNSKGLMIGFNMTRVFY